MSINIEPKYLNTDKTCVYFDLSSQYLMNNKQNGTFINGVHYIQPSTKLLRWNIFEIEKLFGSKTINLDPIAVSSNIDVSNFLK